MCYIINYTILKTIFNYYGKMENRDGSINSACEEGKARKVGSVENNAAVAFGKISSMGRKN